MVNPILIGIFMENSNRDDSPTSLIFNTVRDEAKSYQQENLKIRRQMEDDFFNQSLDYRDFVFSPEGYEGIVLGLYFLTLPYLSGLMFLFLFIAEANYEYFLAFNLSSFFIIWAIGYEVCAVAILIGIFIAWMTHIKKRWDKEKLYKTKLRSRYGL